MDTNQFPANPIAAVTHADPYPYYTDLVTHRPLYRDEPLGLWIASSAAAVTAALTNESCRVRPANEPVPTPLLGSPAEVIYRRLIRMNDGNGHCPFNRAVAATINSVAPAQIAACSNRWAKHLLLRLDPANELAHISDFAFKLSTHVIGDLLGVPEEQLDQTSNHVGDFVRCIFPSSTPDRIERGKIAAGSLLEMFDENLARTKRDNKQGLLVSLAREAERLGQHGPLTVLANGIGLLSQAYEATAGLIGNSLLTLAKCDAVRQQVVAKPRLVLLCQVGIKRCGARRTGLKKRSVHGST